MYVIPYQQACCIVVADLPQNLLDPKVRKRLLLVFHAWSIQYKVGLLVVSWLITVIDLARMNLGCQSWPTYIETAPAVQLPDV